MNQNGRMKINEITSRIIEAAIRVHSELGPGLLESVYQRCMVIELKAMELVVEAEVPIPVTYRGQPVTDEAFRMDLLVEDVVVVENKSVADVPPIHKKQLLTYLRLARKPVGLLINFNEVRLKDGITRIVNNLDESQS